MDARATDEWMANVTEALAGEKPAYLVVHHMEPDHGANVARLAALYPEMQVVGNAKTFQYMEQFFGPEAIAKERFGALISAQIPCKFYHYSELCRSTGFSFLSLAQSICHKADSGRGGIRSQQINVTAENNTLSG